MWHPSVSLAGRLASGRRPAVAVLLTLALAGLVACGDDDGSAPVCGNGVLEGTETCDDGAANGTTRCGCQADCQLAPGTTVCREPVGPCDATELCDGLGACPADALLPMGTVCRPPAGVCDREELCSGTSTECPFDMLTPGGTVCRHSADPCDPSEACDGTAVDCPADVTLPDTTTCDTCGTPPCQCLSGACVDQ